MAPYLVAIGLVAAHYAVTAGHWTSAVRPLFVALLVAAVLHGAFLLLSRDRLVASVGACLGVLLVVQPVVGLIGLVVAVASAFVNARRGQPLRPHPAVALVLMGSVFLSGLINVVVSGSVSIRDLGPVDHGSIMPRTPPLPNIYVLMLDGYARADTLEGTFSYDNEPFLDELRDRSFDVSEQSTTAYDATSRTILGALSGSSDDMPDSVSWQASEAGPLFRELRRRLAEAPALTGMHQAGYESAVVLSPIVHVAERGWDTTIDTGQLTDLEIRFLRESPIGRLLGPWVMEQLRDRLHDTLEVVVDRSSADRQQVVLAHLMAPHPPFLYASDGSPMTAPECWPESCHLFAVTPEGLGLSLGEYGRRFAGQTNALNALVLSALDSILANDPSAVVVVMSDHGSRYSGEDEEEPFRNLFAIRSPTHPEILGLNPSTDQLFQRIIDALLADAS